MSDRISLTASMRSNLLSLQNTQDLFDDVQTKLSTGNKVNSALDNPSSFFTARSLSNRASDLNNLMDSMGQAVQTLTAADEGITTLTSLVEQAEALVNSALDSATQTTTLTGTVEIGDMVNNDQFSKNGDVIHFRNGNATKMESDKIVEASDDFLSTFNLSSGEFINVTIGGVQATALNVGAFSTVDDFVNRLDAVDNISAEIKDGKISIETTNNKNLDVYEAASAVGTAQTTNSVMSDLGFDAGVTYTVSTGQTINEFVTSLNAALETEGMTAELVDGQLRVSAENGLDLVVTDTQGTTAKDLGSMDDGSTNGSNERATYATQFDALRSQITQLVDDTSYKGVNLLKGDDLTVIFNESRSSKLDISGVTFDANGLGIDETTNNWESTDDINDALADTEAALTKLRDQATTFGNNLSVVETREDFTENMVNTLETGADKLTLADMNEEAANMLALQTRQSLGTNSLSLASQSAQSVLQLF